MWYFSRAGSFKRHSILLSPIRCDFMPRNVACGRSEPAARTSSMHAGCTPTFPFVIPSNERRVLERIISLDVRFLLSTHRGTFLLISAAPQ